MVTVNVLAAIVALAVCIPSGIVSFCFWALEKKMERRQKDEDEKQEARQKEQAALEAKRQDNEYITIKCLTAALALGEATARAVERIPDANCDGDMHAALEYAQQVQREQKDFLEREGIEAIYSKKQS